ncbi:LptF/LptG family permease [Synoicihabitans lomoniglobus]|uniref:LptF/LptG family permease n=1 Tax=Synoicihabitans lomoniglobus TaxID=2909285 RepID=A0AAF0CQ03_9BACT|nr:LptF/LptG family permease [Opitutaceae bacterium LMO-M01]WED65917.1 LptF/LptG family permease [Opitutaceae bacterium LMO-M01]
MNLLHRHIFWSVLTSCLAAVGLFSVVLILGNVLKDMMSFVLAGQLPATTFLYLMGLLIPYVAAYSLPMGMLTGVLLVLGRMSSQREITAMRAAGMSMGFIARPIVILAVLATAASMAVNFEFMPRARTAYKQILAQAVQTNPLSFIVPKTFVRDFPNLVLYVDEKEGAQLRDVWFWRLDKESRVREFGRAGAGEVSFDEEAGALQLVLRDVVAEARSDKDPEDYSKILGTTTIGEVPLTFRVDDIFSRRKARTKYAWMTYAQLSAERTRLQSTGGVGEVMKLDIAVTEKASSAVAVLAFSLLAIPLGIKVSRKETSANLGIALLLVMGYYFLTVIVSWLENSPELRPDLLMWGPAALFLLIGLWLFRRVDTVR